MITKTFATLGLAAIAATTVAGLEARAVDKSAEDAFKGVASRLFMSQDANHDQLITKTESNNYAKIVFASMDANENGTIDRAEFLAWDPGFVHVARSVNKLNEVESVKMQAFTVADTNGSGTVDATELTKITQSNFAVADADEDGTVTLVEFTSGFPIVAYIGMALNS